MTDVACFCGCCYSFDGGAGACPRCGECAVVRPADAAVSAEPAGGSEPAASSAPMPVRNQPRSRAGLRPNRSP